MARLWTALENAIFMQQSSGQDSLCRFLQKPWESEDARVRAAWLAITDPANQVRLETRWSPDLNPLAREYAEAALKECRSRGTSRTG